MHKGIIARKQNNEKGGNLMDKDDIIYMIVAFAIPCIGVLTGIGIATLIEWL